MSRARDMANLGAQAGSGLDANDITTGTLGNTVQDNITRLGTVTTGTLGSSVVVPASIGGGMKLTKSYSGTLSGTSYDYVSHDAFSSTYDNYLVLLWGYLTNGSTSDSHLRMRLSKSNGTNSDNSYWSVTMGRTGYSGYGAVGTGNNNSSNMTLIDGVDNNNWWQSQFYVSKPATSNHTFINGTAGFMRDNNGVSEQGFTAIHGTDYSATGVALSWDYSATTSVIDLKIFGITST